MNVVCGCEIRADANDVRRVPVVGIAVVVDIAGVGGRLHTQNRSYPKISLSDVSENGCLIAVGP